MRQLVQQFMSAFAVFCLAIMLANVPDSDQRTAYAGGTPSLVNGCPADPVGMSYFVGDPYPSHWEENGPAQLLGRPHAPTSISFVHDPNTVTKLKLTRPNEQLREYELDHYTGNYVVARVWTRDDFYGVSSTGVFFDRVTYVCQFNLTTVSPKATPQAAPKSMREVNRHTP